MEQGYKVPTKHTLKFKWLYWDFFCIFLLYFIVLCFISVKKERIHYHIRIWERLCEHNMKGHVSYSFCGAHLSVPSWKFILSLTLFTQNKLHKTINVGCGPSKKRFHFSRVNFHNSTIFPLQMKINVCKCAQLLWNNIFQYHQFTQNIQCYFIWTQN